MAWIELELLANRDAAPLIEAALETAGALAVTLDDGNQGLAETASPGSDRHPVLEPAPGETADQPSEAATAPEHREDTSATMAQASVTSGGEAS